MLNQQSLTFWPLYVELSCKHKPFIYCVDMVTSSANSTYLAMILFIWSHVSGHLITANTVFTLLALAWSIGPLQRLNAPLCSPAIVAKFVCLRFDSVYLVYDGFISAIWASWIFFFFFFGPKNKTMSRKRLKRSIELCGISEGDHSLWGLLQCAATYTKQNKI